MIGRTLEHYRILERLGSGGMGEVYLAEDTRLGRQVAVKVLTASREADPQARERFLLEARAASALEHPNICTIHEVIETPEGTLCLVMAHYDGETLERRLAAGPLPVNEAVAVAEQVAAGLAKAHAKGIVHRDIKPSNVMLTSDGYAKVLDFGIAKVLGGGGLTLTGTSVGTPAFMSPEQVRGDPTDVRSDVWSVGVLLHVALTARPPFLAADTTSMMFAILEREPEDLARVAPHVPAGVRDIVNHCLRKDRAERYADARELMLALRAELAALAPAGPAASTQDNTLPVLVSTALRATGGASRTGGGEPAAPAGARRSRAWLAVVAAAVLAITVWAAWPVVQARFARPLRVAVLPASVAGVADSAEAARVALGAEVALLGALAGLQGTRAVDPGELRGISGAPQVVARGVLATDLVQAELRLIGNEWNITVRRLRGADGSVAGVEALTVPDGRPLLLANALALGTSRAFPDRAPRAAAGRGVVSDADYAEFAALYRAFRSRDAAGLTPSQLLERLGALARQAPQFADAQVLLARVAFNQYLLTHQAPTLQVAVEAARRARKLAPEDPVPLGIEFQAALQSGRLADARVLLEDQRRMSPGDPEVLRSESQLAEREGRSEDALRALQRAVAQRPSKSLTESLADLELRLGRTSRARGHLDSLVTRYPDDRYPLSKLAQLELLYGQPSRADTLYSSLLVLAPGQLAYITNRGLARMLAGRLAEAASDFQAALASSPGNASVQLNLADTFQLMGRHDQAAAAYRTALALASTDSDTTDAASACVRAQCLAHLGQWQRAVEDADRAVRRAPDDSEALYAAALVYSLAGEHEAAARHARKALEQGVGAGWFEFPWFDALRRDADFGRALAASRRAT